MKKKNDIGTEESLAARVGIQRQIDDIIGEINMTTRGLEGKKRIAQAATRALDDFKKHTAEIQHGRCMKIDLNATGARYDLAGKFNESGLTPDEKEQYDSLTAKVTAADAEASSAVLSLESLQNKKNALLGELPELEDPLAGILLYQKKLAGAEQKVASLQTHIAGQQEIIKKANADIPTFEPLLQRRQDLMAEIATGSNRESALEELNKQIKVESQKVDKGREAANAATENAQHTIAGLQRKLAAAQEELDGLNTQGKDVILSFLLFEAGKSGAEYARLARELVASFRQMMALSLILEKKCDSGIDDDYDAFNFRIPRFHIPGHGDEKVADWYFGGEGILTSIQAKNSHEEDLEAEKARIASLGVTI